MKVKKIKTEDIKTLRCFVVNLDGSVVFKENWIEGVDLWGYWEEGKSFIFTKGEKHICITKKFLEEVLTSP